MKRFWDKVAIIPEHSCWEWIGSRDDLGYGHFRIGKKIEKAHRVSYSLSISDIPKGLLVCHKCDNPSCVRPEHLFLGTNKDNKKDSVSKNRHYTGGEPPYVPGEKCGRHVLTEKQVLEIRKIYTGKHGQQSSIAREYGVNRSTIYLIVNRKKWTHI